MRGLPRLLMPDNSIYKSSQFGKQTRTHFKSKEFSSSRPLDLIHTGICGPTREKNPKGEKYYMFLIDDFTRATWILLLKEKLEVFKCFNKFKAQIENEKDLKRKCLISDRGGEYTSREFEEFYEENDVRRQYLVARTPQQNLIVERKKKTIQEMARKMIDEAGVSHIFQGEATNEILYISSITQLRPNINKSPYELWKGRPTSVKHIKMFGSKCFIKRNNKNPRKFDSHTDEGILLGYSIQCKAYKCYKKHTKKIQDCIEMIVYEIGSQSESSRRKMNSDDEANSDTRSTNLEETDLGSGGEEAGTTPRSKTSFRQWVLVLNG